MTMTPLIYLMTMSSPVMHYADYEANIRDGVKTSEFVFKYMTGSLERLDSYQAMQNVKYLKKYLGQGLCGPFAEHKAGSKIPT
jgi:hypothetical protein